MNHDTTPTPRTDAKCYKYDSTWQTFEFDPKAPITPASFARQLERELVEKTNEVARLTKALERAETAFKEREADRDKWAKESYELLQKSDNEVARLRELLNRAIEMLTAVTWGGGRRQGFRLAKSDERP